LIGACASGVADATADVVSIENPPPRGCGILPVKHYAEPDRKISVSGF
jgi:hypothetical protein